MNTEMLLKSVLEQDSAPVVLCDVNHTVLYMNPAAVKRYEKRGGAELIGKNLMLCHNSHSRALIEKALDWFRADGNNNILYEFRNDAENKDVYTVALRDGDGTLIGYYEKHMYRDRNSEGAPLLSEL